jgi:hypothetical protein
MHVEATTGVSVRREQGHTKLYCISDHFTVIKPLKRKLTGERKPHPAVIEFLPVHNGMKCCLQFQRGRKLTMQNRTTATINKYESERDVFHAARCTRLFFLYFSV